MSACPPHINTVGTTVYASVRPQTMRSSALNSLQVTNLIDAQGLLLPMPTTAAVHSLTSLRSLCTYTILRSISCRPDSQNTRLTEYCCTSSLNFLAFEGSTTAEASCSRSPEKEKGRLVRSRTLLFQPSSRTWGTAVAKGLLGRCVWMANRGRIRDLRKKRPTKPAEIKGKFQKFVGTQNARDCCFGPITRHPPLG